jgi:hypothetical protein
MLSSARFALVVTLGACSGDDATDGSEPEPVPLSTQVFDEVVFYDGYAPLVDEPVPDGVLRLRNDLVARRLDDEVLDGLLQTLGVDVEIGARCDNYDRIGAVNLAFVPAGATTYVPAEVPHVEVGRFITPFMDKNVPPRRVPYRFDVPHLLSALTGRGPDTDVWVELEVFGVPYAANEEVDGCAGRNDVFEGSVTLVSDPGAAPPAFDELLPLAFKSPFNDYQDGASDALGVTRRTLPFDFATDVADAQLVLIISQHGAAQGGEEYERREHFVSVDGEPVATFVPGRNTCEPFRRYNTQPNGIYGPGTRTRDEWQSFSNWCPGDVIDTRIYPLGAMAQGEHEVVIEVPDAVFLNDDGTFPLSVYVQSRAR